MDYKSEPSLVPEWLKNSGSVSATVGGTAISSLLDVRGVLKPARTKSSDSLRSPGLERVPSSYLCRNNSSSNRYTRSYSSFSRNQHEYTRSYSSFSRNQHDRDWDFGKDVYREKSIFSDYRPNRDYSDPLGNNLRRARSSISRKVPVTDGIKSNGNTVVRGANKASFEREFPSLVAEERRTDTEINRVPSPVSSTIQNLAIGSSAVVASDGWASTLAEMPVIVTNKGSGGSALSSASIPVTGSVLNMAETVAQGPCVQITAQMSSGTQRLEELALKQSRQLIPVITSVPKTLLLNASDKSKPKIGTHQLQSSRGAKPDASKISAIGKLHVLKPTRERNSVSDVLKDNKNINNNNDCVSPMNIAKSPNSPLAVAPLRSLGSNPMHAGIARKPVLSEKRPTPNTQSRHDFFNLMRKKSMNNSSSGTPNPDLAVSSTLLNKHGETETAAIPQDRDNPALDRYCGAHNGKILIPYAEEEEVLLLRSMGWDENSVEDEGLTEEEINAFLSKYANTKPSTNAFPRLGSAKV